MLKARLSTPLSKTLAIIMGGGRGSRLSPLTDKRSKPAVPLGGKYRLVDIPISNCLNSDIGHIFVLTQFNSESLNRHISDAYKFDHFEGDFVRVLAAQQTPGYANWYQGTADAVRQNMSYFLEKPYDYFLILSGDQLYRMDFLEMLEDHIENEADLSIATTPVGRDSASSFGILQTDAANQITRFVEKPGDPDLLNELRMPASLLKDNDLPMDEERFQASMGIYIFNRRVLQKCLQNKLLDFGSDIIPAAIEEYKVFSYVFKGYWEDIGTIKSFHQANLDLTENIPHYNFFDADNPIYTRPRLLPASKVNSAHIKQALISDGCIISNATIERSIIGVRSHIMSGCLITDSVIMGSDYYFHEKFDADGTSTSTEIKIGENTRIHRSIVDKNACIGRNVVIDPGDRINEDGPYCKIRDGIAVIPKSTIIPDDTVI
jgi:glucose-1-phosphate adenylyltransferase